MVKKAQIFGVIRMQVGITVALVLLLALLAGKSAALSGLCGGAISLLGSLLYARIAFRTAYAPPAALLRMHFAAEMAKLALTFVAFAALFVFYRQVAALWVFVGYLAAASAYWFGLLFKFDGKK
ncbi:ATP synthase subunit I [Chitinilyticum piscinae]|uniref:ATP synthase subunit I n=1 Tax=Chitinilyticum piscinae TaxID=2866724 RepID=A0A8J7K0Q0_9NEIS|nr:ATP synthase subunit I [Chitinilyticum piscinae]MBE9608216.1 ATP synthase subunit I [Chitinilyticum piscinae]